MLIGADAADVCVCSRARVSYASACVVEYETCVRHLHTCNFVALISGCVCVCVCVCVHTYLGFVLQGQRLELRRLERAGVVAGRGDAAGVAQRLRRGAAAARRDDGA